MLNYDLDLSQFYNSEQKKKYILSMPPNTFFILKRIFIASKQEEERLGKDLAFFNKEQLMNLYSYMAVSSINSLVNIHSKVKNYMMLYNHDLDPSIYQTSRTELIRHCNKAFLDVKVITKEQLDEYLNQLKESREYNICYSFLLLGLWEGLSSTRCEDFSEITKDSLRKENSKYYIKLPNRELEISEELYNYGYNSSMTSIFYRLGKKGVVLKFDYFPSNLIVKENSYDRKVGIIDYEKNRKQNIRRKITKALTILEIEKFTTAKSITLSSQISMVKDKAKELGISDKEVLYHPIFTEIAYRYGAEPDALKVQLLDYIK